MKFNKVLNELKGEVGRGVLTYKEKEEGSPKMEIAQQSIVNAVFAFVRSNKDSNKEMAVLWKEWSKDDPTELDITAGSDFKSAIIKTEEGTTWKASLKTVGNHSRVLNIVKQ